MAYTLQILHASDWEGGLLAAQRAGNFAAIADFLEDQVTNSITLSSGDGWIPGPFYIAGGDPSLRPTYNAVYNQFFGLTGPDAYNNLRESPGRADITIQNIIGVQASAFGNHEFDAGTNEIRNVIGADLQGTAGAADDRWVGSFFPYLSTNLNFTADTGSSGLADLFTSDIRGAETFATGGPSSTGTGTGADKIAKSTIITENGEQIAVIGATTQILPNISSPGKVTVEGSPGADNIPLLAQQINAEVARVLAANPGLDKVIVSTHLQQIGNERALAPLLENVDVLIAGGSNTRLTDGTDRLAPGDASEGSYPEVFTNASGQPLLLVNTDGEYSYVGRLVFEFDDNGNVIAGSVNPAVSGAYVVDDQTVTELWGSTAAAFAPGTKGNLVQQMIEGADTNGDGAADTPGVADVIRAQDGNILGKTSVYLEGRRSEVRTEETNFGNLSNDANLWYARQFDSTVQVSVKNGGGIRDSIGSFSPIDGSEQPPAANPDAGKAFGDISQLDVQNSLRFNNGLTVVTLTAAELEQVLEHAVAATAPGATPGQFAQVSGIDFSFDATEQAQVLDSNGAVTTVGNRIQSAVLVNDQGVVQDVLVENGQLVGDPNREIRAVTLDFLANQGSGTPGLGGDRYPFPAFGEERFDLRASTSTNVANTETFAAQGTEQDALAEYLKAFFSTTPFSEADTSPAADTRIQNLAVRSDTVLDGPRYLVGDGGNNALTGFGGNDTIQGGDGNDTLEGGAGLDLLFGEAGDDLLIGGTAPSGQYNQLWGAGGSDTASYAGTTNRLYASVEGNGAFVFEGGSYVLTDAYNSIENLIGGSGGDLLVGDGGANRLTGAGGADQLYGRGGADTFVYVAATDSSILGGYDTIADFQSGVDSLDLSAFGIDASRVRIASDARSTALYADTNPGAAGFELAVAFIGANALTTADIVF